MTKRKVPGQRGEVQIEFEGKTYRADFAVDQGMVTVTYFGSPPETLARIMLREMIQEGKRTP
jgi:hypothetical protein